jgi:hypothetical protein
MIALNNYVSIKQKKQAPSLEYYRRRCKRLEKGIIQKRYAVSTKNNIDLIKKK